MFLLPVNLASVLVEWWSGHCTTPLRSHTTKVLHGIPLGELARAQIPPFSPRSPSHDARPQIFPKAPAYKHGTLLFHGSLSSTPEHLLGLRPHSQYVTSEKLNVQLLSFVGHVTIFDSILAEAFCTDRWLQVSSSTRACPFSQFSSI